MVDGILVGDGNMKISNICTIQKSKPGSIAFYYNKKYSNHLATSEASAIIAKEKDFIKKDGIIIDAIGRALKYGTKWHRYGNTTEPFLAGTGDDLYLVEDAASACAVSEDYAGVALMGTSLPTEYISTLQNKFDNIIVALDRDATSKAFDIARELGYRSKTRVVMLEDDLKYFKPNEIRDILCKNDN